MNPYIGKGQGRVVDPATDGRLKGAPKSHPYRGQGRVAHPESDRRLKANRKASRS